MNNSWNQLRAIVEAADRIGVTSHVRPDADAIGSEVAFASLVERLGKTVRIVNPGQTPQHLFFLDPERRAQSLPDFKESLNFDVWCVLDTSAWKQLPHIGEVIQKSTAKKVVIDHHVSGDDLGATEFKDTSSPATGCLVHDIAVAWGLPLTEFEATALYAAIATDTGWFRFPATTAETYHIAADLVKAGANPQTIYTQLYEQDSLARLHLMGRALSRVRTGFDGKLVYTFVTDEDFEETSAHPADTENLVNQCLKVAGSEAAFVLVPQPSGLFKCSFRSRHPWDVSKLAESLGGGGHKLASGATIDKPLEEALSLVLQQYELMFASQPSQ